MDTKQSNELRRCPFCGSKAEYSYRDNFGSGGARCSNQSCFASHLVYREYNEWNNRPIEEFLQKQLNIARNALEKIYGYSYEDYQSQESIWAKVALVEISSLEEGNR